MTNQYALGYKAGLEAAAKVCCELNPAEQRNGEDHWYDGADACADAIAALPVPEVQWRDLTDQEIVALERELVNRAMLRLADQEAAPVQLVKQKPVAWPVDRNWFYSVLRYAEKNPDCFDEVAPDCVSLDSCDADTVIDALNAAPVSAKREWVDLTDDDLDLFWVFRDCHEAVLKGDIFAQFRSAARAVIAAFKEKNK